MMRKTKRLLVFVLILLMLASLSVTVHATTKTVTDAINWVESKLGQGIDYDGQYGNQCVDLIMAYYAFLGVSPSGGNGGDYAWNTLPSGWSRVQGGTPQPGDILVYSGNSNNSYGHVGIYGRNGVHYHQNFNGCSYVVKASGYAYNQIDNPYWGYIRPNFNGDEPSEEPRFYDRAVWGTHIYELYNAYTTWTKARDYAASRGGHLVTITSAAEQNFLLDFVPATLNSFWVGLTDEGSEGNFRWITGESVSYTNWGSGEPNNSEGVEKYVGVWVNASDKARGDWNDFPNYYTAVRSFVVEYDYAKRSSVSYNGASYELYSGVKNWETARAFAELSGGHLAAITSAGEQQAVQKLVTDGGYDFVYIGASDKEKEGDWRWVTGEPFSYTNWDSGDPNNWENSEHYLTLRSTGKWADEQYCHSKISGFIVEYDPVEPDIPKNVTAKPTGNKAITVSWSAVSGATQYNVYRYNGEKKAYVYLGTTFATAAKPTQYVNTGLTAGSTYYYRVVAVNKSGGSTLVSGKSDYASAKAIATPAVPTGVAAKATASKALTVSWKAVPGATQYNIYRYNGAKKEYVYKGTTFATAAKPTQYIDNTVTGGVTYYYKVVSVTKSAGLTLVSGKSAAANAKAVVTPAVPTGVAAKPTADKTLTVSWTAVSGATQYNIYRYNGSTKSYAYKGTTFATAAKPTQYIDKGLTAGATYYYRVVAVTKDAGLTLVSAKSDAAGAKAIGTPAVPEIVTATGGTGKITLLWAESTGATQYNIYRYNGTKKEYVYKATSYSKSYVDTSVAAGTTYYYKVVPVTKSAGLTLVGAYSASVNAKAK